jgi:hypothetical protein
MIRDNHPPLRLEPLQWRNGRIHTRTWTGPFCPKINFGPSVPQPLRTLNWIVRSVGGAQLTLLPSVSDF